MPDGITGRELDRDVRDELRSLSRETADRVAAHMVAAWALVDVDAFEAFLHAKFAARRGGRIGSVRETYGIVAYRAGEFATAGRELRTAVRITGRSDLLPMIADCERALGRPERAFEIAASPEAEKLDLNGTIEMMIVVAGAYADTGDVATALSTLEIPALRQKVDGAWHVRLWVAYADLLERAGRDEEARKWLTLAADTDTEQLTDAAERLGRPAPVVEDPTWQDDEQISVLDAFVGIPEEADDATTDVDDGTREDAAAEAVEADLEDAIDAPAGADVEGTVAQVEETDVEAAAAEAEETVVEDAAAVAEESDVEAAVEGIEEPDSEDDGAHSQEADSDGTEPGTPSAEDSADQTGPEGSADEGAPEEPSSGVAQDAGDAAALSAEATSGASDPDAKNGSAS